jgi:DNA primase
MKRLIDQARPAIEYLIMVLKRDMEDTIPGRSRVLQRVAPIVAKVGNGTERDLYADYLALELKIDVSTVQRLIRGQGPSPVVSPAQANQTIRVQRMDVKLLPPTELNVLGILIEHPHLMARAEDSAIGALLTNDGLSATYQSAKQLHLASGRIDPEALLDATPNEVRDAVARIVISDAFTALSDPTRALDDCLKDLKRKRLERERHDILNRMAQARKDGDPNTERALAIRKIEVEREIHETR